MTGLERLLYYHLGVYYRIRVSCVCVRWLLGGRSNNTKTLQLFLNHSSQKP